MLTEHPGGDHGNIPQMNPSAANHALANDIDDAVRKVLSSGQYILGQEVASFEREFARWLGGNRAIGCASGTDALPLALTPLRHQTLSIARYVWARVSTR